MDTDADVSDNEEGSIPVDPPGILDTGAQS